MNHATLEKLLTDREKEWQATADKVAAERDAALAESTALRQERNAFESDVETMRGQQIILAGERDAYRTMLEELLPALWRMGGDWAALTHAMITAVLAGGTQPGTKEGV